MARDENPGGHKLFIGGLPNDCTAEELQIVFSTYGPLADRVHVMQPKSKSGLRCAFVVYKRLDSAEDAIKVLDGQYKIRDDAEQPIQVRWPRSSQQDYGPLPTEWCKGCGWKGSDQRDGLPSRGGKDDFYRGRDGYGDSREGFKLFVGALPSDCTEEDLRIVFNTYGEVKSVHLMQPHPVTTMRSAFLVYGGQDSAEDAIKVLDGIYKIRIDAEHPIQVRWANERGKGGTSHGGGGGGGGGSYIKDYGRGHPHPSKGSAWWEGGKSGGSWWDAGHGGDVKGSKGSWQGGKEEWNGGSYGGKGPSRSWKGGHEEEAEDEDEEEDELDEGSGHRIHVSNLPEDIHQNALEYVFGTYGKVEQVHILSKKAGGGRTSAFIDFAAADEADTAIASLHEKYEIRPGYGPLGVKHAACQGRSKPY